MTCVCACQSYSSLKIHVVIDWSATGSTSVRAEHSNMTGECRARAYCCTLCHTWHTCAHHCVDSSAQYHCCSRMHASALNTQSLLYRFCVCCMSLSNQQNDSHLMFSKTTKNCEAGISKWRTRTTRAEGHHWHQQYDISQTWHKSLKKIHIIFN